MDFRCKKQTHGDNRIAVLEVQSDPPLVICNVYMPARNSKGNSKAEDSYQSSLDQLEEILSIYKKIPCSYHTPRLQRLLTDEKG